eukprot:sb/3463583/
MHSQTTTPSLNPPSRRKHRFIHFNKYRSPMRDNDLVIWLQRDKIGGGYMAPGTGNYHVGLYVPSLKGAHAYVQLYQYGAFERQGENNMEFKMDPGIVELFILSSGVRTQCQATQRNSAIAHRSFAKQPVTSTRVEQGKQPIRTPYLGHVTGYQPIRDQYVLIRSVPGCPFPSFFLSDSRDLDVKLLPTYPWLCKSDLRSALCCCTFHLNFQTSIYRTITELFVRYYGQTLLYFITTGGESNQIVLNKNGPVYSVEWNPSKDEFIVLYGFMPCRATLFNTKCDPTHQFGDGHYNEILFNPQGNMVGLCGFGNLRGKMKFFSMENKKLLSDFTAADTTFFEWSPSGDIFLAGTLSPRLRQDNEFKVWNVSGKILLHQKVATPETQLWQLKWVQPLNILPAPTIPRPLTTQEIAASKPQAYRPPGSRDRAPAAQRSLIDHGGPLPNVNKSGVYKPGHDAQMNQPSKNALRNQKKRENKQDDNEGKWERGVTTQAAPVTQSGVDEKEKKIRNLKKKLFQVTKLKEQQKEGKELEKNQLEKIKTEGVLLAEIKALELS